MVIFVPMTRLYLRGHCRIGRYQKEAVLPSSSLTGLRPCAQVAVRDDIAEGPERQREQLHKIWELAAVQQFLRSFRSQLGVTPLTTEDFHTAFLDCSSALKVCSLLLVLSLWTGGVVPAIADGRESRLEGTGRLTAFSWHVFCRR